MHVIYDLILNKAGLVSIIFLFIIIGAPYLHPYYRQIIHCKLTPIIRSNLKIKPTILVQMTQEKIFTAVSFGEDQCASPRGLYAVTHPSSLLKFIYLLHLTTKPAYSTSSVTWLTLRPVRTEIMTRVLLMLEWMVVDSTGHFW